MQIIPVIDLKNGIVVHAKQGNRDHYAPIKSEICTSSDIFDVIDVFLGLFYFKTVYIADLNAITRQADNAKLLTDVLAAFPTVTFWVDSGYPICNDGFLRHSNFVPVLGSESFNEGNIREINIFKKNFILSLDYSIAGELGAKTLFSNQGLWPENIIIMSLPRVGSTLGPDLDRLAVYSKHYPQHKIIAAGGVRNNEDLRKLERIGIRQALVATALHNGNINAGNSNKKAKKYPD
jgi:phosphoribosylformimino-5-aminoimidazole carboxamide ribotide isomerase